MHEDLEKEIHRAVQLAASHWEDSLGSDSRDDVVQEVWYEYLTRPSTRRVIAEVDKHERINLFKRIANRHFSEMHTKNRVAGNDILVPVETVKSVLKGDSPAPLLTHLVEVALLELQCKDNPYAEALHRRYTEGVVPTTKHEENSLFRAHTAITNEVNAAFRQMHQPPEEYYDGSDTAFPTLQDGPKLGNAVEPGSRKATGGHNDPTGEAAVALVMNPAGRELFYEETPLAKVLAGKGYE